VTQFGNASQGPGGVASVVHAMNGWADQDLEVRAWPTYWHGDRGRTLVLFAWTALRAVFVRVGPGDVWHFHMTQGGSFWREGLLLVIARRRGVCCTASIHGSRFVDFARGHPRLVGCVLRSAWAVFVLTDASRDALQQLGVLAIKVANPVSVDGEPWPGGRSGFVFAGEIGRRKGADVLLSAWASAQVHDHELAIFGGLEPGFQLPVPLPDGVVLEGLAERDEVLARLRTAVALVLPSRAEAMPMTVLESMSMGTPVIGTDVGQIAEVLGDTGLVIPPGDPDALRTAIRRLVESPDLSLRLGRMAWARVRERHSTTAVKRIHIEEWSRSLTTGPPHGRSTSLGRRRRATSSPVRQSLR
jgi:glycosyltransferase involved in cell wall biosynthesis